MIKTAPSKIHGKGVFATEKITNGTVIGVLGGPRVDKETMHSVKFGELIINVDGKLKYLNHSTEPNCELEDYVWVVAITNINEGDELTFNYGDEWS